MYSVYIIYSTHKTRDTRDTVQSEASLLGGLAKSGTKKKKMNLNSGTLSSTLIV